MAKVNVKKMSRDELLKLRDDVDAQLKVSEKAAKKSALDAAKKAAAAHGFSLEDIMSNGRKSPGRRKGKAKAKAPAAAKYANPSDKSQTWSGRGRQPNWLKEAMAKGKSLNSMAI